MLIAAVLGGCKLSSPLSHDDAATIIRAAPEFNAPKVAHVPRQLDISGRWGYGMLSSGSLSTQDIGRIDPTVAILKLRGLADINDMSFADTLGGWRHVLTVTPAASLDTLLLPDEAEDEFSPANAGRFVDRAFDSQALDTHGVTRAIGWKMVIGEHVFDKVEQIHNWKDPNVELPVNELAVDFTWHWRPNPAGDVFDSQSAAFQSLPEEIQDNARRARARMNTTDKMLSRAFMRRAGKKWFIYGIQWDFGRGNPG